MIPLVSSALVSAIARVGFKLADRYEWLPKDIYHRKSLDALKTGNLEQAAQYNRIALRKNPDYEKALIMQDIIFMKRDASLNSLNKKILYHEQSLLTLIQRQAKIKKSIKSIKWITRIQVIVSILFILACLFTFGLTALQLNSQNNLHWIWPVLSAGLTIVTGYFFFSLPSLRMNNDLKHQENITILNALECEMKHHSRKLRMLKGSRAELKTI